MSVPLGVQLESQHMLQDVSNLVNEYGDPIVIYMESESTVTRDAYNSIKSQKILPTLTLNAFPVVPNPTIKNMEKAGLFERTEIIIWLSALDWYNTGYNYKDIDITRLSIDYEGDRYYLKEKNLVTKFGDKFLYITLGLSKR